MADTQKAFNLSEHLMSHLKNEIDGFNGYMDMAETADKKGNTDLRDTLLEMAYDEYSHACYIYNYSRNNFCAMTEECSEKYTCMVKRYEEFFCS